METQIQIESQIIETCKPLFEAYPELSKIPFYAWGRYYKYESAGSPFELTMNEDGFSGFYYIAKHEPNIDNANTLLVYESIKMLFACWIR